MVASHPGIRNTPAYTAHRAPLVLVADFHTAFIAKGTSHQTNISLSAGCIKDSQFGRQKKQQLVYNVENTTYVKLQADKPLQHLQCGGSCEQQEGWKHSQLVSLHYHCRQHCQEKLIQCLGQKLLGVEPQLLQIREEESSP